MGATSVSYLSIDMCEMEFGNLENLSVLMVGTGDTGSLALQGLYKKGIRSFLISNRTKAHADKLVAKYNAEFIEFSSLGENLYKADIIIVATGAKEPIILSSMVKNSIEKRNGERQFYIDLSVPRNIENFGLSIKGARVIGVDDLQVVIDANKEKRAACIEEGTEIIQKVVTEFMEWLSFRNLQPAIRSINYQLEKIFRDEVKTFTKDFSEEERLVIQKFNEQLIQKYSRKIITNLKSVTNNGKKEKYLKIINDLFNKA